MLPPSIRALLKSKGARPCEPSRADFPYSRYNRSIAAILLSGRVRCTAKKLPNATDVTRLCKEANFNVGALFLFAERLRCLKVIRPDSLRECFHRGESWDAFFSQDVDRMRPLVRAGFCELVQEHTPVRAWRSTTAANANLDIFLRLYCAALRGVAIPSSAFAASLVEFAGLPQEDLSALAAQVGVELPEVFGVGSWKFPWLDEAGLEAIVCATNALHWFEYSDGGRGDYLMPSYAALVMLGLEEPACPPVPARDLVVQADLSVMAGEDLPFETLVPLFRGCRIERIDRVVQFKLSAKHLTAVPGKRPANVELAEVLGSLGPLPDTVSRLLGQQRRIGGELGVRPCSGLIKPADPEQVEAIRSIEKLKGFVEPGGPPGYLLVKAGSSLHTFVERCKAFGFVVKPM